MLRLMMQFLQPVQVDEYEQPALDPATAEALDDYVERRRAEIGDGEP